jgi:hypothetical protein
MAHCIRDSVLRLIPPLPIEGRGVLNMVAGVGEFSLGQVMRCSKYQPVYAGSSQDRVQRGKELFRQGVRELNTARFNELFNTALSLAAAAGGIYLIASIAGNDLNDQAHRMRYNAFYHRFCS